MLIERQVDCGGLYEQKRGDLIALARSLSDEQLGTIVPATPAWSVRDVLAHVVGISADLNAGRLGGGDPDDWTAAQVLSRRGRSIDELTAEWDTEAPTFEAGLGVFGYEVGAHFVGDLLQHIADVHHALGLERIEDDEALLVGLDFYLSSFHESLRDAGIGAVTLQVAREGWEVGTGAVVASWTADRYEAFRALGGRRSEAQIRAMDWSGDVDRVVGLVSRYQLPRSDILERSPDELA